MSVVPRADDCRSVCWQLAGSSGVGGLADGSDEWGAAQTDGIRIAEAATGTGTGAGTGTGTDEVSLSYCQLIQHVAADDLQMSTQI